MNNTSISVDDISYLNTIKNELDKQPAISQIRKNHKDYRKYFSKSYTGSINEFELIIDNIADCKSISYYVYDKKRNNEKRRSIIELNSTTISKTIKLDTTKSLSIYSKLLGYPLSALENFSKINYIIRKNNDDFRKIKNINVSIQKSREYTSKFEAFNSKIKNYDNVLKTDIINIYSTKANKAYKKDQEPESILIKLNTGSSKSINLYNIVNNKTLNKEEKVDSKHISSKYSSPKKQNQIKFGNNAYNTDNKNSVLLSNKVYNQYSLFKIKNMPNEENLNNTSEISKALDFNHVEGITPEQVEYNLRNFQEENKNKFAERLIKGPPNCFRWISWMIISKISFVRSDSIYNYYYLCNISDNVELQIKKDLNRTFPETIINMLPQNEIAKKEFSLYKLLKSFAANDTEVGYCQGMNYIANFLLLMSDFNEVEAFYTMLSLFSSDFGVRGFYTQGFDLLNFYIYLFHYFLEERNPKLRYHILTVLELDDQVWIGKWIMTLFTISFPFEIVARIWDCLFVEGLEFLIKFALALLTELESKILKFDDTFDLIDFFKSLSPFDNSNLINENSYFQEMSFTNIAKDDGKALLNLRINIESILSSAIKIKLNTEVISQLKIQFEKKHNISLAKLSIKYDLNKHLNVVSLQESKCSSEMSNIEKRLSDIMKNTIDIREENNQYYNFYGNESDCELDVDEKSDKSQDINLKLDHYNFIFNNKGNDD